MPRSRSIASRPADRCAACPDATFGLFVAQLQAVLAVESINEPRLRRRRCDGKPADGRRRSDCAPQVADDAHGRELPAMNFNACEISYGAPAKVRS